MNKESLKEIALQLMFELKENEYDELLKEFEIYNQQFALLDFIDGIDNASPMLFPYDSVGFFREDNDANSPSEDVLSNCSSIKDYQIVIPKVIK